MTTPYALPAIHAFYLNSRLSKVIQDEAMLKNVFKTIMVTLFIFSLLMGVATFFVYKDAMDLKDNHPKLHI